MRDYLRRATRAGTDTEVDISVHYEQIIAVDPADTPAALASSAMAGLHAADLLGAVSESTYDGPAREFRWGDAIVGHAIERTGVRLFDSGEATRPPSCPSCGTEASNRPDVDEAAFKTWLDGGPEPELTCSRCGFHAHWTSWDVYEALVCSDVGIVLHLWTPALNAIEAAPREISEEVRQIITRATDRRWVVTHQHS